MEENVDQAPPTNKPPFGSWWKVGVLVVGTLLAASIFYTGYQYSQRQVSRVVYPTITPSPTPGSKIPTQGFGVGTIEGSLSYPSEVIPPEMKVCAEDLMTKEQFCTEEHLKDSKFTYGEGYRLEVPVGTYYVFAVLGKDYKAYYSEFVTCGLKFGCPSHNPIPVTVKNGQVTQHIDPQDWYK